MRNLLAMFRTRLGVHLAVKFGVASVLLMAISLTAMVHREHQLAEAQVEHSAEQTGQALVASLKAIMLAGKGPIAHSWLQRVRKATSFDTVRIFRRDGTEAFVDNATIDHVNAWLGEKHFAHHDRGRNPIRIPPQIKKPFDIAAKGVMRRLRGNDRLTLLMPIHIETACLRCHGYDNNPIRGVLELSMPTGALVASLAGERNQALWITAVVIMAAGLILLWLFNREVIRPIRLLQIGAEKIKQGDTTYRVSLNRKDEMGNLAVSLNQLVEHLNQQIDQRSILFEAIMGLSHELADEEVLKHIGELAMQFTGARYCMLSYKKDGEMRFIPLGLDEATLERLKAHPPQGLGLLGLLWQRRQIVRTESIPDHPDIFGFSPGHPSMTTLLGAPIEFAGEMIGALYLCDKKDGQPFSESDEIMVRILSSGCAVALSNAHQFERLAVANATLEDQVAERTSELRDTNRLLSGREIELELMNDELRQANEAKNQFLANTSHELRTPLNAIIGFSDLLLAKGSMSAKQTEYIGHINGAGKQLLGLINNLLDLSKIEAGMLEINEEPGSAGVILDYVVSQLKPLSEKKGLEISVKKPEKEPAIYLDTGKLRQIWVNLVGNAIKFTPDGNRIEAGFDIAVDDEEARLTGYVQDSGIGIASEDIDRIFLPFVQAEGGLTREYGGTGLGLALVRRMLEMQGGDIKVESEPGKGSRFVFTLPVRLVETAPEGPLAALQAEATAEKVEMQMPAAVQVIEPELSMAELPFVLIVDDDRSRAVAVSRMLEAEGYRGEICDLHKIEHRCEEICPFLIMVGMPEDPVDIYKRLHLLRSRKATRHIPLVLLGGDAESPSFSLGTVDTVDKQMSRNELVDLITRHGRHTPMVDVMTVLVIDDEANVREYVKAALEGQRYRVLLAENGREGLRVAIEHEPDLIILDLMMPGMSGFEVVEELKRHPTACDIPVVIFTAKELSREEVMRLGQEVEKVLTKGMTGRTELLRELRSLELLYPVQARLMDSVLRCYNQRYLKLRLVQECGRGERYGQRFSLAVWRMDGYDAYVQEHSQRWGLAALKDTVELVNAVIRKGDVLVCSGKAEFTLILSGITPRQVERVVEKIRLRIRLHRFPLAGGEVGRFTASFGCAFFPLDGISPKGLIDKVNVRVHKASQIGGDRCVYSDEDDQT